MTRHDIPTATYWNLTSVEEASKCVENAPFSVVVKASGLAGGKGVRMPCTKNEGLIAVDEIMHRRIFGSEGTEVVIEEFLVGDEISISLMTDGNTFRLFPLGQDAQRILDGNIGANTGGMGVYAPTNLVSDTQLDEIKSTIIEPTLKGMRDAGHPLVGFICLGVMMTKKGPMLIEYNVRFGDPEAQTLLPLLDQNTDLARLILACTQGSLSSAFFGILPKYAVSVVIASHGYPEDYQTGMEIDIDTSKLDALVFHAGTKFDGHVLWTDGGRVLSLVVVDDCLEHAIRRVYENTRYVHFQGMHFRKDIGIV